MAEEARITTANIVALSNERFGTKNTVLHYVRIAKNAGDRAKAAATIPNAVTMGMELAIMNDALMIISNLLNDERSVLPQEK